MAAVAVQLPLTAASQMSAKTSKPSANAGVAKVTAVVPAPAATPVVIDTITGVRGLGTSADQIDDTVPGLSGVILFPHQRIIIARLLRIIDTNRVVTSSGVIISTNSALLSLALGGGKTFIAISLLLLRPSPRLIPGMLGTPHHVRVTQRFTGEYVLLKPALIVAAPQVIEQWKSILARHTQLQVFTVSDYYDLKKLVVAIGTREINRYDIVMAKAGMVMGTDLNVPGEAPFTQQRNLVGAIAAYTERMIWSWVMYDDFDTAGVAGGVRAPNAAFTLYISATCSNTEAMAKEKPLVRDWKREPGSDPIAWLRSLQPRIMDVIHDPHLLGPLSVRVSSATLAKLQREAHYELPAYLSYSVIIESNDNELIKLITAMGGNGDIVNMLNGEAVATAASQLNIVARGAADILNKLLGDAQDQYNLLTRRSMTIRMVLNNGEHSIMDWLDEHPHGEYTEAQLASHIKRIRKADISAEIKMFRAADKLNKQAIAGGEDETIEATSDAFVTAFTAMKDAFIEKTKPKGCPSLWFSPGIVGVLKAELDEVEEQRKIVTKSLEGIRDNFREQRCGVCKLEYDAERPLFINRCCGAINCMQCGIKCNRFHKQYNHKTAKQEFFGNCASCGKRVNPSEDMIFVERVGSLETIMEGAMIVEEEIAPADVAAVDAVGADPIEVAIGRLESLKCRTLIRIVLGRHVEAQQLHKRYEMVIEGNDIRMPPPDAPRKVLLFADYDETLNKSVAALQSFKIGYDVVGGTPANIASVLADFENNPAKTVLVVNSHRNSSGMNLDVATDIVFFHSIDDPRRLAQAVARAQRYGRHRKYSLRIWFIIMSNEMNVIS